MTRLGKRATVVLGKASRVMSNHERRQQPRVEWSGEAIAAFGTREVRLRTRDLSVGGCCVETQWCPSPGERVGLVLHVDGAPVGTWAEVAWASPTRPDPLGPQAASYLWGLRFVELEQTCRAWLEAYIDHCVAVDMLDAMLRDSRHPDDAVDGGASGPAFAHGEIEEAPTRIFSHLDPATMTAAQTSRFFPIGGAPAFEGEATSEIDVESTLTSEVPHTHTVQVDLADLYRRAAEARALPLGATMAPAWEPDIIDGDAPGWDAMPSPDPSFGWDARPRGEVDCGWDRQALLSTPEDFVIEPLAAEPFVTAAAPYAPPYAPPYASGDPEVSDVGDPFWVEPVPIEPEFPAHAQAAWPSPAPLPVAPYYSAAPAEANTYAKAEPVEHAFDPHAFDPQAFAPQAFAPAPEPPPEIEIVPLSADALLDLKRKRIDALLSSVPRRASAESSSGKANASKGEPPATEKAKVRARPPDTPDTGLRRLFDQALRDVKRDD